VKVEILGVVQPVGAVGCDARGDKTPSLKRDAEVSIYLIPYYLAHKTTLQYKTTPSHKTISRRIEGGTHLL
jgi:hypothetical protein